MKVAILSSGGKDSAYAVGHALSKGWEIDYILTVVPNRKDCYLFHYATTEHANIAPEMLGIKHISVPCTIADPVKEAEIVKHIIEKNKVDAVILGGVGLQVTQIKSIQNALKPFGIEVFAAHAGLSHESIIRDALKQGYKFMITQFASDGLKKWLGVEINEENFEELKKDSQKYGFHLGFEGGYADTFCVDAPHFPKRIKVLESEKVFDGEYTGHLIIKKLELVQKENILQIKN